MVPPRNGNTQGCAQQLLWAITDYLNRSGRSADVKRWRFEISSDGYMCVCYGMGSTPVLREFDESFFRRNNLQWDLWEPVIRFPWASEWRPFVLNDSAIAEVDVGWRYRSSVFMYVGPDEEGEKAVTAPVSTAEHLAATADEVPAPAPVASPDRPALIRKRMD